MTEAIDDGAPFVFASGCPPTASAIDEDIYLTVTTEIPDRPGRIEAIDIIFTLEYAEAVIAELSNAVRAARSRTAR